jgi:NAD(P)H-flavin reductase/ferredoxin
MPMVTLKFADGDCVRIESKDGETILRAARRAGLQLSSDCEVGDCQTCRATCLSGQLEYDELASVSLTPDETAGGETLPCVAMAATDVELRLPYERAHLIPPKPFSIKIEEARRLSASVIAVKARVLGLKGLRFLPGQYVNLQIPGTTEWRSYSMANAPAEPQSLEFLVRLLEGGVMSRYLIERASPGDVVQCSGPQGTFYLRGSARPILMVAGGTGVAPMVSMLRQMIASQELRHITLCFGVTAASDLFFVDELTTMGRQFPAFEARIAIAQGSSTPGIHSGFVTDLIGSDSLADTDVYLCGPPAMTDRAREIVAGRGALTASIFSERFLPSSRSDAQTRAHELM